MISLSSYRSTYLVEVAVAPHLAVNKCARDNASLLVKLCPLTHTAAVQAHQPSCGRVGHVYHSKAATGLPNSRSPLSIISDP